MHATTPGHPEGNKAHQCFHLNCAKFFRTIHCVKSVRILSFSGPYFPAFGLNTERYGVSLRIQSECRKKRTRKSLNTDNFYAVIVQQCTCDRQSLFRTRSDIYGRAFIAKIVNSFQRLTIFTKKVLSQKLDQVLSRPLKDYLFLSLQLFQPLLFYFHNLLCQCN